LRGVNSSRKKIGVVALLGTLALLFALAAGAGAATHEPKKPIQPLAKPRIGRVTLGETPSGDLALLVAVRYPIQTADRVVRIAAHFTTEAGTAPLDEVVSQRLASGELRKPERRRTFTYVHEIDLKPRIARRLEAAWKEGGKPKVTVEGEDGVDIDGDGKNDFGWFVVPTKNLPLLKPLLALSPAVDSKATGAAKPFCASVPVADISPGAGTEIDLPACTRQVNWDVTAGPTGGSARISGDALKVTAPRQAGTTTVKLNHATVVLKTVAGGSAGQLLSAVSPGPVVRAMGDSVTAGYGYYSDGSQMSIFELPECKPFGAVLDDACSSNSTATKHGLDEVPYAPDYGLSNDISWAAQWANDYGVTNYKNYAISGSEPTNWAPGGDDYALTQKIEAEDPDYILMTIGANPILAKTLFGLEPMACAIEADILGDYRLCVEEAFEAVNLRAELKRLYANLVENTTATIYLMQYHLSVPSSALAYTSTQIAEMAKLMNETIAEVAQEVGSPRLQVISPPHFDVGVNLEPVYPSTYSCSHFGYTVDGPSVQSNPTQDELALTHPLSFCKGPASGGPPWVISGDTGIHPSAIGYAQMASQVPPPTPQN
jgi:lysophospholipase L1-like esterase